MNTEKDTSNVNLNSSTDVVDKFSDVLLKKAELDIKQEQLAREIYSSNDPTIIMKAQGALSKITPRVDIERKSFILDPNALREGNEFQNRPIAIGFESLNRMSKTPIINAIIKTRVNQVASFAEPQRDKYSTGFKIQKRRGYGEDQGESISKSEQKVIDYITDFILNCGSVNDWETDTFDTFVRKITRDSLVYDQCTFEVVYNQKGYPVEFIATDASTYRIAQTFDDQKFGELKQHSPAALRNARDPRAVKQLKGYYPSYVQIHQGLPVQYFYPWELCFGVRNPSTALKNNGYGVSELEEMIVTITNMLWADEYNRRFFNQGSAPKGIIKVKGNINETRLQQFKQQWLTMVAGVTNAWKTPIMNADEMEWVDLQKSNRDMEFSAWMEYLIKIGCAIFQIDPSEVNFPLPGGQQQSSLFEGSNKERLKHSKDKGLYPLLKFLQQKINKYIVNQIDDRFEFVFSGLEGTTYDQELDRAVKRVSNFTTINEERTAFGLKPLPDEQGDIVLNSIYFQAQQAAAMADQEQDMGGGEEDDLYADLLAPDDDEEEGEEFERAINNPFRKAFENFFTEKLQ